jgi:hypothetical protein
MEATEATKDAARKEQQAKVACEANQHPSHATFAFD